MRDVVQQFATDFQGGRRQIRGRIFEDGTKALEKTALSGLLCRQD
jgi:hypothetical protein